MFLYLPDIWIRLQLGSVGDMETCIAWRRMTSYQIINVWTLTYLFYYIERQWWLYNFDTVNCFNIILVVHVIAYCKIHSNCINVLPYIT